MRRREAAVDVVNIQKMLPLSSEKFESHEVTNEGVSDRKVV